MEIKRDYSIVEDFRTFEETHLLGTDSIMHLRK